jgi:hypothetical protein
MENQRLLNLLNIPPNVLNQCESMSGDPKEKFQKSAFPFGSNNSPRVQIYYKKVKEWNRIEHIFVLNDVKEAEFCLYLCQFIFNQDLGAAYFDALESSAEAANAWVKSNLILQEPDAISLRPEPITYLDVRSDNFLYGHSSFSLAHNWRNRGLSKALHILVKKWGVHAVLKGNIVQRYGNESSVNEGAYLEYFHAMEDMSAAVRYLAKRLFLVEERGSDRVEFATTKNLRLKSLLLPQSIYQFIRYGLRHTLDELMEFPPDECTQFNTVFGKHGMPLVKMLKAMIPHSRRVTSPQVYPRYKGIVSRDDCAFGVFDLPTHARAWERVHKVEECLHPPSEMRELSFEDIRSQAYCLSGALSEMPKNSYFEGFLRDGQNAYVISTPSEEKIGAMLWLPEGTKSYFVVVVRSDELYSGWKFSIWGFVAERKDGEVSISPYQESRRYCIGLSKHYGLLIYDQAFEMDALEAS